MISASCVAFKAECDYIYNERDKRIKEIKETFKQTSPQYQASIEQAKEQAEKQLMQARVDYSKDVLQMASEIEDEETTAMWKVNRDKLADIKAISDLPLTVAEITSIMTGSEMIIGVVGHYHSLQKRMVLIFLK